MSAKTDNNEYETEDEESMLHQDVDDQLYSEIIRSLSLNVGNNQKPIDRALLAQLVELKKDETKRDIERLKLENLNKLDLVLSRISALNLPQEIVLALIQSSPNQLEANLNRIGVMPLASHEQLQSWSQVTPPQTHTQIPAQPPQHLAPLPPGPSPAQIPPLYHTRNLSQPVEMGPSMYKQNQTQKQQLRPNVVPPGAQQMYALPSLGPQQVKYYFPPPPPPMAPDASPNSSVNSNRSSLYYPARYNGPPSYYGQPNAAVVPPEHSIPSPASRMGHKRSYSAMTVPEMSTFTIQRNSQNELMQSDPLQKSSKVSFLINTPKNPPK